MTIEVNQANLEDKCVLRNLLELYAYDFSKFDQADVDSHGLYGYEYLDNYWIEDGRRPFLVKIDGKLAGFVLVRTINEAEACLVHSIAEFFILRKYRKNGVGRAVAYQVFDMFPGQWSVAEMASNLPAQAFWRKIISDYTNGNFEEKWFDDADWRGPIQRFISKPDDIEN